MTTPSTEPVGEFFARQQDGDRYASLKAMTEELDRAAATVLNARVRGDVLCVGGVWDFFERSDEVTSITVLDLSIEMLDAYCPDGATAVCSDFYNHEFPEQSFDTIVFPLMLHHTAEGDWRRCGERVATAIDRAGRWLRPGGQVTVLEYCPQRVWHIAQRVLLPITRRILARSGQPLVVMHRRADYERLLAARFGSATSTRIDPAGFDYWKWYPVFMSSRWLRIPLALYPHMYVIGT